MKKTYQLAVIAIAMMTATEGYAFSGCQTDILGNSYCQINTSAPSINGSFAVASAIEEQNTEGGSTECMMDALGSTICF